MKTASDLARAARWFHALSDETRLEIVRRLGTGERCVCDLTDVMGDAQSRLSFHLKTLKLAGIVTDRKGGRWVYYALDRSDAFCLKMAAHAGARAGDVLCFGHTHVPWYREAGGIHFVNTGSVGRPKDGDWRAGYVVLDVSGDIPAVDFVRVEYDLDAAVRGIRASGLPDDSADRLATGGRPAAPRRERP